jgi:hypothetical protein
VHGVRPPDGGELHRDDEVVHGRVHGRCPLSGIGRVSYNKFTIQTAARGAASAINNQLVTSHHI